MGASFAASTRVGGFQDENRGANSLPEWMMEKTLHAQALLVSSNIPRFPTRKHTLRPALGAFSTMSLRPSPPPAFRLVLVLGG